jgi:hypothetical protein
MLDRVVVKAGAEVKMVLDAIVSTLQQIVPRLCRS